MAEYIEREAALKVCNEHYVECLRLQNWSGDTVAYNIADGIRAIPAADVVEVVHGEWEKDDGKDMKHCNCCGYRVYFTHNYCPNCGAKMDA